jgi:UDP-3-O-[3-hydroxymyristoyl] glucosamine N-acyltransferase
VTLRLPRPVTLQSLVERHGGALDAGLSKHRVATIARLEDATADDLSPLLSRRWLELGRHSAALLLVDEPLASAVPPGNRWVHRCAGFALAAVLQPIEAARARRKTAPRVHRTARIARGARLLPGAVVGAGARIEPNAVVYGDVLVGARAIIGAGAVVGRPGFGWATGPAGELVRVPQLGGVIIGEDAEIGPLCTVDAGTLSPTRIGRGVKLDAQVHVGHNVEIADGTLVAAQAGFAGSVRVGRGVLVGGQAGIADHVTIGDGARIGAAAGVIGDVAPGATVAGYPAVDRRSWLRATALGLAAARRRG